MRRDSLRDITRNVINVQSEEEFAIELNASRSARKRVRLTLRSFVKRSRLTLRSSQSQNELERLQTKLRRLKEKLQRLQEAQQTFTNNVKMSIEKLRASQRSQEERNNSRESRNDSSKKQNDSREHTKREEIRFLQELAALFEEEDIELSQRKEVREDELNLASQKQNHSSQNFEFVQQNSQRNHNASEIAYRVAYISK